MRRCAVLLSSVIAIASAGCSGSSNTPGSQDAGSGGSGGADGSAGDAGGDAATPSCTASVHDPSTLCTAPCGIVLDATIECGNYTNAPRVALGVGNRGFISFERSDNFNLDIADAHFATIDPAGATVEDLPTEAIGAFVASDAAGDPHVLYPDGTHATPSGSGWATEPIAPGSPDERVVGTASNDEAAWGVLLSSSQGYTYAFRGTAGWTYQTSSLAPSSFGDFAFDAAKQPHVAYWQLVGTATNIEVSVADGPPITLYQSPGGYSALALALAGDEALPTHVVANWAYDLNVFVEQPSGPALQQKIPGTESHTGSACPAQAGTCADCTEKFDGGYGWAQDSAALARTSNGTVWLAYTLQHVDRDWLVQESCGESGCSCQSTLAQDRSTTELVLASVSASAVTTRLSATLEYMGDGPPLDMSSRQSQLAIAVGGPKGRYLLIDTAKL